MNRRLAMLAASLMLGACATPPRPQSPEAFWSGRIGLQVMGETPQNLHVAFELQGSAQNGELTLLGPVSSVLARLSWNPRQAMLERGNERWVQPTVEALTQQLVQTPLPVQLLFDWIEGRPVTHAGWEPDLSARTQGRITARRTSPAPEALLRILLDQ